MPDTRYEVVLREELTEQNPDLRDKFTTLRDRYNHAVRFEIGDMVPMKPRITVRKIQDNSEKSEQESFYENDSVEEIASTIELFSDVVPEQEEPPAPEPEPVDTELDDLEEDDSVLEDIERLREKAGLDDSPEPDFE